MALYKFIYLLIYLLIYLRIFGEFWRLYVCVLYAFVPHLVNQHIDNLFSSWAASIDKHIASLAARHCAFFFLVYIS